MTFLCYYLLLVNQDLNFMMIKTKLFDPNFEKDNCGFGLIAQKDGIRSRSIVNNAIEGLTSMTHRGAIGSDKKTGDGCGLLFDLNHNFFKSTLKQEQNISNTKPLCCCNDFSQ